MHPTSDGCLRNFQLGLLQNMKKSNITCDWYSTVSISVEYIYLRVNSLGHNIGAYLVLERLPSIFPNIILQIYIPQQCVTVPAASHSCQHKVVCIIFILAAELHYSGYVVVSRHLCIS